MLTLSDSGLQQFSPMHAELTRRHGGTSIENNSCQQLSCMKRLIELFSVNRGLIAMQHKMSISRDSIAQ